MFRSSEYVTRFHTSANRRLKKALAGRLSAEKLPYLHLLVDNGDLELKVQRDRIDALLAARVLSVELWEIGRRFIIMFSGEILRWRRIRFFPMCIVLEYDRLF